MRAKDFLKQVRICDLHIYRKLEDKARLEALATKTTPNLTSDVVQGGGYDKIADSVIKIIEIEEEIDAEIEKYRKIRKEVERVVERIQEPLYLEIIYKRYFEGLTFERLADEIGISKTWAIHLHAKLLEDVQEIMSELHIGEG